MESFHVEAVFNAMPGHQNQEGDCDRQQGDGQLPVLLVPCLCLVEKENGLLGHGEDVADEEDVEGRDGEPGGEDEEDAVEPELVVERELASAVLGVLFFPIGGGLVGFVVCDGLEDGMEGEEVGK